MNADNIKNYNDAADILRELAVIARMSTNLSNSFREKITWAIEEEAIPALEIMSEALKIAFKEESIPALEIMSETLKISSNSQRSEEK